jgi:hypothetical protein
LVNGGYVRAIYTIENIKELLKRNRFRLQQGELIETETAFFVRYYVDEFYANGRRKTKCEKLADKQTSTALPVTNNWHTRPLRDGQGCAARGQGISKETNKCRMSS